MSDSLWPGGLQHARLPCPPLSLGVCSNCVHRVGDVIWPSQPLLSPSPPAFSLSKHQGLFQLFASGGQSIRASASALPMNIQDWFLLGLEETYIKKKKTPHTWRHGRMNIVYIFSFILIFRFVGHYFCRLFPINQSTTSIVTPPNQCLINIH